MNKEMTEKIICEWISGLGYTRAISIKLKDVRELSNKLFEIEHPNATKADTPPLTPIVGDRARI
jgi:hypothetical protein